MPIQVIKKESVPICRNRKNSYEDLPEWKEIKEVLAIGLKPHEAIEVKFPLDPKIMSNGSRRSRNADAIKRAFVLHCEKLHLQYDVVQRVRDEYAYLYISAR